MKMKHILIGLFTTLMISCSPAPKDPQTNQLSDYSYIGNFKGVDIYRVNIGNGNSMKIGIKSGDSSVVSIREQKGKYHDDYIIINNTKISKKDLLKKADSIRLEK